MGKIRPSYGRGTGMPHPVDVHVGARVRQRRTLLGMTQTTLGKAIGLTFQQVQKYERGANRIGSSRLFDLSRVLEVPIEYFFGDMPAEVVRSLAGKRRSRADQPPSYDLNPIAKRETLELVRAYYRITDSKVRKRLFELTKALGAAASRSD
jgi:transcriptional regulator with XRE-family HTH domain